MNDRIKPHAQEVGEIWVDGDVAVIVFELEPEMHEAVKTMGWDGASAVFRMSRKVIERYVVALKGSSDRISAIGCGDARDRTGSSRGSSSGAC